MCARGLNTSFTVLYRAYDRRHIRYDQGMYALYNPHRSQNASIGNPQHIQLDYSNIHRQNDSQLVQKV